jgi:hypothetical protein
MSYGAQCAFDHSEKNCNLGEFAESVIVGAEVGGIGGGFGGAADAFNAMKASRLASLPAPAFDAAITYGSSAIKVGGGMAAGGFLDIANVGDGKHVSPAAAALTVATGGISNSLAGTTILPHNSNDVLSDLLGMWNWSWPLP